MCNQVNITELPAFVPTISERTSRGLVAAAGAVTTAIGDAASILLPGAILVKRTKGWESVASRRTTVSLIQDFLERRLFEAGIARAPLGHGQRLFQVGDCDQLFKIVANREDAKGFSPTTNTVHHLLGNFVMSFRWIINFEAGLAGVEELWIASVTGVRQRKRGTNAQFGGNVGRLTFGEIFPLNLTADLGVKKIQLPGKIAM